MGDLLFVVIGVGSVLAFIVATLITRPRSEPPQVIYVQRVE